MIYIYIYINYLHISLIFRHLILKDNLFIYAKNLNSTEVRGTIDNSTNRLFVVWYIRVIHHFI